MNLAQDSLGKIRKVVAMAWDQKENPEGKVATGIALRQLRRLFGLPETESELAVVLHLARQYVDLREETEEVARTPPITPTRQWTPRTRSDADKIRQFKALLTEEVLRQGGVSEVAVRCGFQAANLNRILEEDSKPQRRTIAKLAMGLNRPDFLEAFDRL